MNHDYDKIEEDLKEQTDEHRHKKKHKISGRSVFKLQEIIKKKSKNSQSLDDTHDDAQDRNEDE